LSGFFGVLALLLAMVGLYGIMSYQVARRRREIGIRIAFGAGQPRVLRMVLGQVGGIVLAGIFLGLLASLAATRLVSSFLYGVQPNEPAVLLFAALALLTVALAAGLLPARRAARLDPVLALREE
jgi:ABC-type antimicrobial peptide transport system permease subunit